MNSINCSPTQYAAPLPLFYPPPPSVPLCILEIIKMTIVSPWVSSTLCGRRDCGCSRQNSRGPGTRGPRTNARAAATPNECCQSGSFLGDGGYGSPPHARSGDWTHLHCGTSPGTPHCGTGGAGRTGGR